MTTLSLPPLPAEFEPTRATLHAYAKAVGELTRTHAIAHPKWWHVALKVRPEGFVTDPVPLPNGGALAIRMDLRRHEIVVRTSTGAESTIGMRDGLTGTDLGDRLARIASGHGLDSEYDRDRSADDSKRAYDPQAAEAYFSAFTDVQSVFEEHRVTLGERISPIHLWPHGFDLAFEWYGTRTQSHTGEDTPPQINLGFYPEGDPYFYSNPWPFDEALTASPLPHGAEWKTDGWSGSILPYHRLQGDPQAAEKLTDFARAVFDAAAPALTAG